MRLRSPLRRRQVRAIGLSCWLAAFATIPAEAQVDAAPKASFRGNYVASTQSAPLELAGSIPLRAPVKIAGSEAFVEALPSARGAGMLVDTRITGLLSLIIFGTTDNPPIKLPTPTVSEVAWTSGPDAEASSSLGPRAALGEVGLSYASAGQGPKAAGEAAYVNFHIPDLLEVGSMASRSTGDGSGDRLVVSTETNLGAVSILGGAIRIAEVRSTAMASTDGVEALADSTFDIGSMTVGGIPVELGGDLGVQAAGQPVTPGIPVADLNATLRTTLNNLGVTIELLQPKTTLAADGRKAAVTSRGLWIKLDPTFDDKAPLFSGHGGMEITLGFAEASLDAPMIPVINDGLPGLDGSVGTDVEADVADEPIDVDAGQGSMVRGAGGGSSTGSSSVLAATGGRSAGVGSSIPGTLPSGPPPSGTEAATRSQSERGPSMANRRAGAAAMTAVRTTGEIRDLLGVLLLACVLSALLVSRLLPTWVKAAPSGPPRR